MQFKLDEKQECAFDANSALNSWPAPCGTFSYQHLLSENIDDYAHNFMGRDHSIAQISAGQFKGDIRQAWLGNMQISWPKCNVPIRQVGHHWGDAVMFLLLGGRGSTCYSDGRCFTGEALYFSQHNELRLTAPVGIEALSIVIPRGEHQEIERLLDRIPAPQRCSSIIRLTPQSSGQLLRFGETILRQIDETPSLIDDPTFRIEAPHQIVSVLSESLADSIGECEEPPRATVRGYIVNRALELIAEHEATLDEMPITIADICKQLKISRRTLQYSFEDVLHMSPGRYLMAARLNRVRRQLGVTSSGDRVQDAAFNCGFGHLGRLAHHYRSFFGELPSETLRSRKD